MGDLLELLIKLLLYILVWCVDQTRWIEERRWPFTKPRPVQRLGQWRVRESLRK